MLIVRGGLVALPFVIWFLWAATARGVPAGRWARPLRLAAGGAGGLLLGLSLVGTVVFHPDNRAERYVPGEVTADGAVSQGRFVQRTPATP